MASPTLTELFDFAPYPQPKPGRELAAEVAINGAAQLGYLLDAIEFVSWGGGLTAAGSPAERFRDHQSAVLEAVVAANSGHDELAELVHRRCPGVIDVLNTAAARWPEADPDGIADRLVAPKPDTDHRPGAVEVNPDETADRLGPEPEDELRPGAMEAWPVLVGALRARLQGQKEPSPRLTCGRAVLEVVDQLNIYAASCVIADALALDKAACSTLEKDDFERKARVIDDPDPLTRDAESAILLLLDLTSAYKRRRSSDPKKEKMLKSIVDGVFKRAKTLLDDVNEQNIADLQCAVERAYERARKGDDLRAALGQEVGHSPLGRLIAPSIDHFLIPVDDSDPAACRDDGEAVSIVGLTGPVHAASTMVKRFFSTASRTTLEQRAKDWKNGKRVSPFGVTPTLKDRLQLACRLVSTGEEQAQLLIDSAIKINRQSGWVFQDEKRWILNKLLS